jgi:hypothetical protein
MALDSVSCTVPTLYQIEMGAPCVPGGASYTQRECTGGVASYDARCASSGGRVVSTDQRGGEATSSTTSGYNRADKRYFSRFIDASCGTVSESRAFGSSAAAGMRLHATETATATDPCCGKRIVSYRKLQALKTRHAYTFH